MYRVMLDTGILLDALIQDRPESQEAAALLEWCNGSGDMGIASSNSLSDVYYLLRRYLGENRARESVEELMGLVVIGPISSEECSEALRSNEPDFGDGLVRACAELNDCDFIITRDKAAYTHSDVKSVTAKEFLVMVRNDDKYFMSNE